MKSRKKFHNKKRTTQLMRVLVDDRDPNVSNDFLRPRYDKKGNEEKYAYVHMLFNVDALRIVRTCATIVQDKTGHPRMSDASMFYLAIKLLFDYNAKCLAKTADKLEIETLKFQLISEMQKEQNRTLGEAMQADQKGGVGGLVFKAEEGAKSDDDGFKSSADLLPILEKSDETKGKKPLNPNGGNSYRLYKSILEGESEADFNSRMSDLEKAGKNALANFERKNRQRAIDQVREYETRHAKKGGASND